LGAATARFIDQDLRNAAEFAGGPLDGLPGEGVITIGQHPLDPLSNFAVFEVCGNQGVDTFIDGDPDPCLLKSGEDVTQRGVPGIQSQGVGNHSHFKSRGRKVSRQKGGDNEERWIPISRSHRFNYRRIWRNNQ
jgi:hypothetical protein